MIPEEHSTIFRLDKSILVDWELSLPVGGCSWSVYAHQCTKQHIFSVVQEVKLTGKNIEIDLEN